MAVNQPSPLPSLPSGVSTDYIQTRAYQLDDMEFVSIGELLPTLQGPSTPEALVQRLAAGDLGLDRAGPGASLAVLAPLRGFAAHGAVFARYLNALGGALAGSAAPARLALKVVADGALAESGALLEGQDLSAYSAVELIEAGQADPQTGLLPGLDEADWLLHAAASDPFGRLAHQFQNEVSRPFATVYCGKETPADPSPLENPALAHKLLGAAFMVVGPGGPVELLAGGDLAALDSAAKSITPGLFAPLEALLKKIPDCAVIADQALPLPFALCANVPYAAFFEDFTPGGKNEAVKGCVHNYATLGVPSARYSREAPTIVVNWDQADFFDKDPGYMDYAFTNKTLDVCLWAVQALSGTANVLVFDGTPGGFYASSALAKLLRAEAR